MYLRPPGRRFSAGGLRLFASSDSEARLSDLSPTAKSLLRAILKSKAPPPQCPTRSLNRGHPKLPPPLHSHLASRASLPPVAPASLRTSRTLVPPTCHPEERPPRPRPGAVIPRSAFALRDEGSAFAFRLPAFDLIWKRPGWCYRLQAYRPYLWRRRSKCVELHSHCSP